MWWNGIMKEIHKFNTQSRWPGLSIEDNLKTCQGRYYPKPTTLKSRLQWQKDDIFTQDNNHKSQNKSHQRKWHLLNASGWKLLVTRTRTSNKQQAEKKGTEEAVWFGGLMLHNNEAHMSGHTVHFGAYQSVWPICSYFVDHHLECSELFSWCTLARTWFFSSF